MYKEYSDIDESDNHQAMEPDIIICADNQKKKNTVDSELNYKKQNLENMSILGLFSRGATAICLII